MHGTRTSGRGTRTYDDYLRESINRQASPKHARVVVEFSTTVEGRERIYKVVRSWEVKGKSVREFLNVLIDGELDLVVSEQWADYVEDLLPLEASSLFFFDGEKIESLANPDRAASVIASAVQSLFGLSSVERLRNDLLAVQRRQKIPREDREALDKIHQFENQIRECDQLRDQINQRVASMTSGLEVAERRFATIDEAFAKEGGDLYSRRAELESERSQTASQLKSINEVLASTIATGPLPLLLLAPQLSAVREQVERERHASEASQVIEVLSERDSKLLSLLRDLLPRMISQSLRST
ncbi:DNA sulfur modification protein DndD [Actinomadura luteofluorescens]|uniref:DNA sulfur modification protein DndD n=1 Tax=Actinomadura luteofluorescens TaxID=46163 RepID=UPI00363EA9D5